VVPAETMFGMIALRDKDSNNNGEICLEVENNILSISLSSSVLFCSGFWWWLLQVSIKITVLSR
jgi:hypothetical protein